MPFGGSGGDDRHLSIVEEEPGRDDEDDEKDEEGDENSRSAKNSHHHKDDNSDANQLDAHRRYNIQDISDDELAKISEEVDVFLQVIYIYILYLLS